MLTSVLRTLPKKVPRVSNRGFASIDAAYVANATVSGSRKGGDGEVGPLKVHFGMPAELGGAGNQKDVNPEQLFGLGYSACFLSALNLVYSQQFPKGKPLPSSTKLTVDTGIGKPKGGEGFAIAVDIKLHHDSFKDVVASKEDAEALLKAAHAVCPYSKATKGNIEHVLTLV